MKARFFSAVCAILLIFAIPMSADAALVSRLSGLAYYDTDLNVTWIADANLAASNTFGVSGINTDGTMSQAMAEYWVNGMNVDNYLGYSDWRLPTTPVTDPNTSCQMVYGGSGGSSANCTGSDLGHLFYTELGGVAGQDIAATHDANYDLFQNVQSGYYWSGTVYDYLSGILSYEYFFDFSDGVQYDEATQFGGAFHGWAMRYGDSAVTYTPLPAAAWLFGSGLFGLIGVARRKAA